MEIVNHPDTNTVIGKPSDMTGEQCGGLPARLWKNADGIWATSYWKPEPAELAALIAGGFIGLNLRVGPRQHPVTSMVVYTKESAE